MDCLQDFRPINSQKMMNSEVLMEIIENRSVNLSLCY